MKKIILFSLAALGLTLASCDMNKEPIGVLNEENSIESLSDLTGFRTQAYTCFRAITGGGMMAPVSLQADNFYGTVNNGNRNMQVNGMNILPNLDDAANLFGGAYGQIANLNYFLNNVNKVLDDPTTTDEEKETIDRYIGEVRFIRAFHYYMLLDRFCQAPTLVNDWNNQLGLQIVTVFNPTGDRTTYPSRSNMAQTIKFIHEDVAAADSLINKWFDKNGTAALKAPMAIYINPMTIKAFEARLALLEGRNDDCVRICQDIIANGPYKLASCKETNDTYRVNEVLAMWKYDNSKEIIYMPFASPTEGRSSWGGTYIGQDEKTADFIPTPYVMEDLYQSNDERLKVYFSTKTLDYSGIKVKVPSFNKFPGNPELNTDENNNDLCNKNKVFRLSEVYLNLAEAAFYAGKEDVARKAIIDLRKARINRYREGSDESLAGEQLLNQIKIERRRELIGEGFRISDLRRWKEGFDRTYTSYAKFPDAYLVVRGASLVTSSGDNFRYTWPIPSEEFVNNPNVAGQQNPGY